jgi:hypothetical protein
MNSKRDRNASTLTHAELKQAIASEGKPSQSDPEAFWSAFRAHATLHPQIAPNTAQQGIHWLRWAVTAACALLVATGAGMWRLNTPAPHTRLNYIANVEVTAKHDAIVVMDDAASQSTMLWIVGMEETNGDKG